VYYHVVGAFWVCIIDQSPIINHQSSLMVVDDGTLLAAIAAATRWHRWCNSQLGGRWIFLNYHNSSLDSVVYQLGTLLEDLQYQQQDHGYWHYCLIGAQACGSD
jgi:hypothetical protein